MINTFCGVGVISQAQNFRHPHRYLSISSNSSNTTNPIMYVANF